MMIYTCDKDDDLNASHDPIILNFLLSSKINTKTHIYQKLKSQKTQSINNKKHNKITIIDKCFNLLKFFKQA